LNGFFLAAAPLSFLSQNETNSSEWADAQLQTTANKGKIASARIHLIRLIRFLSCYASILMKISVKKCNIIEFGTKVT